MRAKYFEPWSRCGIEYDEGDGGRVKLVLHYFNRLLEHEAEGLPYAVASEFRLVLSRNRARFRMDDLNVDLIIRSPR